MEASNLESRVPEKNFLNTTVKLRASTMRSVRDLATRTERRPGEIMSMLIEYALQHVEIRRRMTPVYDLEFKESYVPTLVTKE